jgi:hypothetical protein
MYRSFLKYEVNKLKPGRHKIREPCAVEIICRDETDRAREATSSLHRQIDVLKYDIHCMK